MLNANVSFLWAFAAGFVSFLGPCVLPLIPGYLSFISGQSAEELQGGAAEARLKTLIASIVFVLGFSVVFIFMGASASFFGSLLLQYKNVLNKAAAVMIIFFGLTLIGFFKLPLFRTHGLAGRLKNTGPGSIALLGMAFAVGWTPCV